MAGSLVNFLDLTVTMVILGSVVGAIMFVVHKISDFTSTTKEKLKSKGYEVSSHGVAVHTQKRFNREDYVDATQRGLVKVFEASSFGKVKSGRPSSSKLNTTQQEPMIKKSSSGLLHRKDNNTH